MQRYTIKQIWRSMKESDQGEFVRYEDAETWVNGWRQYAIECRKKYIQGEFVRYEDAETWVNGWRQYAIECRKKYIQADNMSAHLKLRVNVLFCILMTLSGYLIGKLIGWSLGL